MKLFLHLLLDAAHTGDGTDAVEVPADEVEQRPHQQHDHDEEEEDEADHPEELRQASGV